MQNQIDIDGRTLDVWTCTGTVDHVTLRSNTETWTQGGGGYVGPHGGYVAPPQMRSSTTEYKEVRISADDGSARTLEAAGRVTCVPGDRIAFVYASEPAATKGPLVGIINHTEGRWWSFDRRGLTTETASRVYRRMRVLAIIGAVLAAGLLLQLKWLSFTAPTVPSDIAKRIADWDAYTTYFYRNVRKATPVKQWAAEFRPSMDYSVGKYELERLLEKAQSNRAAETSALRELVFGTILFFIIFFATLKIYAKTFETRVNKALQAEIARRCNVGDDAPVWETRSYPAQAPSRQLAAV